MRPFDCLASDCPLLGLHLLEASAGTGKTFAIEHIFVRLLLETEHIEAEQILAVTFTRASARDLKLRIRSNIEEALRLMRLGDGKWKYLGPHIGSEKAERRLSDALAAFDRCQVFTIHGFCYRCLQEFAFEANLGLSLADPDREAKVPKRLRREARKFLEQGIGPDLICPEQMAHLLKGFDSLDELAEAIRKRGNDDCRTPFAVLLKRHDDAWAHWKGGRIEEGKLLEDFRRLSPCYKAKEGDFELQISAISRRDFPLLIKERGSLFAFLDLSNKKIKAKIPDSLHYPAFWEWAPKTLDPLVKEAVSRKAILSVLRAAWKNIEEPLLSEEQWLDPDGILSRMRAAIEREPFAAKVRQKYKAAIIDEFQDTDPLQWEIFRTLFLSGKKPLSALYLVGDPKQSIYRFRKADVYTYFQARALLGEESLFCLNTNYRSSPDLLRCLNALFTRNWLHLPKIGQTIPCPQIQAGAAADSAFGDGKGALHFLIGPEESFLPYAIGEIDRLRSSVQTLSAFAILVKDRYRAEAALRACQACAIPAVARSQIPLGKTPAFQAAYELVAALARPRNPSSRRLAEAGPFSSLCSLEIRTLLEEKGLIFFCRRLLECSGGGEFQRDLKQLVEELLMWESRSGFSFQGVLRFLEELEKLDPEEGGRRHLDTERDAVQILTLHASKGLEFEIVFALGLAARQPGEEEEAEESDAEKLRQLYVAWTRPKRRLYAPLVFSETPRGSLGGSPAGLFCQMLEAQEGPLLLFLERLSKRESLTYEQLSASPAFPKPKIKEQGKAIESLPAPPPVSPSFLHSFTSLAKPKEAKERMPALPLHQFTPHTIPRGAETGIAIHQIFETLFSAPTPIWRDPAAVASLVDAQLLSSPLLPWAEAIKEMVERTLHLPLCGSFSLMELEPESLQTEMEFLFSQPPNYVLGFIDLVFFHEGKIYFVDWKTNWLGDCDAAYLAVDDAMTEHDYWLQARLYAEALRRHVKRFYTEPFEELFGGALYLFVRGGGVCRFKPDISVTD